MTVLPFILGGQTPGGRGATGPKPSATQPGTPQETPPEDLCTIEGQVVNAVTGELLKKASLTLMPTERLCGAPHKRSDVMLLLTAARPPAGETSVVRLRVCNQ